MQDIQIRAFGSGHIGRYRQTGEDPTNHRYRNVILTNALTLQSAKKSVNKKNERSLFFLDSTASGRYRGVRNSEVGMRNGEKMKRCKAPAVVTLWHGYGSAGRAQGIYS